MKQDSSFVITPEEVLATISREEIKELLDSIHSSALLERVRRYIIRHYSETREECQDTPPCRDLFRANIVEMLDKIDSEKYLRAIRYMVQCLYQREPRPREDHLDYEEKTV